mmetsp:Transcript_12471/g.18030  ORF Transcript_12471/g.18030 Transcript_12471/m.18030 type:complete len:453 (-) Transcript_12471:1153-2511(-)
MLSCPTSVPIPTQHLAQDASVFGVIVESSVFAPLNSRFNRHDQLVVKILVRTLDFASFYFLEGTHERFKHQQVGEGCETSLSASKVVPLGLLKQCFDRLRESLKLLPHRLSGGAHLANSRSGCVEMERECCERVADTTRYPHVARPRVWVAVDCLSVRRDGDTALDVVPGFRSHKVHRLLGRGDHCWTGPSRKRFPSHCIVTAQVGQRMDSLQAFVRLRKFDKRRLHRRLQCFPNFRNLSSHLPCGFVTVDNAVLLCKEDSTLRTSASPTGDRAHPHAHHQKHDHQQESSRDVEQHGNGVELFNQDDASACTVTGTDINRLHQSVVGVVGGVIDLPRKHLQGLERRWTSDVLAAAFEIFQLRVNAIETCSFGWHHLVVAVPGAQQLLPTEHLYFCERRAARVRLVCAGRCRKRGGGCGCGGGSGSGSGCGAGRRGAGTAFVSKTTNRSHSRR